MARTLALLVAGAAAVLAAGCGDDDDDTADTSGEDTEVSPAPTDSTGSTGSTGSATSPDAQAYVDAMIDSFDNADPAELQIDREQAQCLAPRWVEILRPERLAEEGIEPEDFAAEGDVDLSVVGLSEAEGNELYDALGACDIDVRNLFIQSLTAGEDLSEDEVQCVDDAIDDDLLRRIMVTVLVKGDDALNENQQLANEMTEAISECPGVVPTSGG
jgi:hypothetical protein